MDESPANGDARLTTVERGPEPRRPRRQCDISVVQDEHRVAAGKLQRAADKALAQSGRDVPAHGGGAGEDDVIDGCFGQRLPGFARRLHALEQAVREAGAAKQAMQALRAAGATSDGFQRTPLPAVIAWTSWMPLRRNG